MVKKNLLVCGVITLILFIVFNVVFIFNLIQKNSHAERTLYLASLAVSYIQRYEKQFGRAPENLKTFYNTEGSGFPEKIRDRLIYNNENGSWELSYLDYRNRVVVLEKSGIADDMRQT
jgi:hypothetical protein